MTERIDITSTRRIHSNRCEKDNNAFFRHPAPYYAPIFVFLQTLSLGIHLKFIVTEWQQNPLSSALESTSGNPFSSVNPRCWYAMVYGCTFFVNWPSRKRSLSLSRLFSQVCLEAFKERKVGGGRGNPISILIRVVIALTFPFLSCMDT